MKAKVGAGETVMVAYAYANSLARIGAAPGPNPNAPLKDTAALMVLYAFAVIEVDGQKCEDRTAPAHAIDLNITNWGRSAWVHLASKPQDERSKLIALALLLEKATAPRRKLNLFVCGGGTEEFVHADYSNAQELTVPGSIGKTVLVPPDPGYVPRLKAEADYEPRVAQARAQLSSTISQLLRVFAEHAGDHPPAW